MVVGFVSLVLAGALRAALLSSGPLGCKLAINGLWRVVLLGQQKGRLNRAALSGSFLPLALFGRGGVYMVCIVWLPMGLVSREAFALRI